MKNFFSSLCCQNLEITVKFQITLEESKQIDLTKKMEESTEFNRISNKNICILTDMNKSSILYGHDFLYILPIKAPIPKFTKKISNRYVMKIVEHKEAQNIGVSQYSSQLLLLNEE